MSGTARVVTKHSPLAFLLYMTKINLTVDGETRQVKWGIESLTLDAGSHQIDVSLRYLGEARGVSSTALDVADGPTTTVTNKAPLVVTAAGRVSVTGR